MDALKKIEKAASRLLLSIVVASAAAMPAFVADQAHAASDVVPRMFSVPEDIGTMVTAPAVLDSSYGIEDGKRVMYTTVTGNPNVADNPAYFNVVDLDNYSLIRSLPLSGGGQSWGHAVDAQGQVYIASASYLYRYSPVTKSVTKLGTSQGASTLYGLAVDDKGAVYGGTYPTGTVFKYDPATNQITDYGRIAANKEYVRAIAYHNGYVYAGTGAVGELYKLNPADGSKTRIPFPDSAGFTPGNEPTVYAMNVVRDFLFVHMSSTPNKMLIYDLAAGQWLPDAVDNYRGMYVSPEMNGKTYYLADGRYYAFDLDSRISTPTDVLFGSYFRKGTWIEVKGDPELPGMSLATILYNGAVAISNFTTNVVKSWMPVVPGTPVSIQSLEFGPDGLLYSTGYQGTYGARYNIATGNKEMFSMGQAEGMIAYGNKMIFGEYPSAHMHELDTTMPLERNANPKKIHEIGYGQDRPFALATGDNKLFTGTIPKLGELGGAISIYDGTEWETYRNVVENQSIMGLAYRNGKLYGSTTVWGGLGIEPTAAEAKIFIWDVAAKRKIAEFVPAIQQAGGMKPKSIGGLSFGPDGLLWGAAYGTIFAMNPDTYEIVKQKEITATDWVFDHNWVPVKLRWDAEGILYTTLGGQIVAVDPSTMAFAKIPGTKTNLMTLGPDGNLYYNEASVLKKISVTKELPPVYADVEVPVVNGGFEQVNGDGTIPGWQSFGFGTGQAGISVSQEQAKEGQNSLLIADTSTTAETGVISDPFPVTPGVEYTGKTNIYLNGGRTIFSMKYYDAAGKEIKVTPAPANYFSSPVKQWANAEFSSIAPQGAVSGKLVLFCSQSWVGTAFFDHVKMYKKIAVETPPQGPVAQELEVTNAGFEQPLQANGAIAGWAIRNPATLEGKDAVIELSSQTVKSGSQSMRLYDNDTALEVAVDSDLIPIVGGRTYTVAMDVNRTGYPPGRSSNRPIVQVRYHDAAGKEMAVVPGVTMSKEVTTALNQWGSVSLTTPAPTGAKFIRLTIIGAKTYVASVFTDNISLTTTVDAEERSVIILRREPLTNVNAGTDVTFDVTATNGSTIIVKEGERTVAQAAGMGEATPLTVTIPAPAAGTHDYSVYAYVSGLGKSSVVSLPAVTVKPDLAGPSITIGGVTEGGDYTDSVSPTVAVVDSGSGVKQFSIKLNGETWASGKPITASGAHTLSVTAEDKAGNTAAKDVHFSVYGSTTLTVDNAAGVYSDAAELKASLTDRNGSPIAGESVAFQVNGQPVGAALTDAQGKAAVPYAVAISVTDATYGQNGITADYAQNSAKFLRGASGEAQLAVSKEKAAVAYAGDRTSDEGNALLLAAQVRQEEDGSPGKLEGLPVRFVIHAIGTDGSRTRIEAPGLQETHSTDNRGQAFVRVTLPAGLYDIQTRLLENGYYTASSESSDLAVRSGAQGEVRAAGFIRLPADSLLGRAGDKLHVDVKQGGDQKQWHMRVEPKGIDWNITSVEWVVVSGNSVYLQGKTLLNGAVYTVRLMAGEASGHGALSIRIWNGSDSTVQPVEILHADFTGDIKVKSK
ncbi:hypothetical protein FE783_16885 [Paenibacillus mesophilus]|uniref:hypothetical protein n=1 Tax=Paenibacillus mesophilus TaxID=2582849 RepID=UPI00110EB1B2|nr:hypothetical protein [Paenibacillus mesophilus]TMV48726.1 hypothetical protein FE783_16885 [Paenibacillus mesophilus]